MSESRRIAELPRPLYGGMSVDQMVSAAKSIAAKVDRDGVEQMIRDVGHVFSGQGRSSGVGVASHLSKMVMARVADPNDECGLVSQTERLAPSGGGDWLAFAATVVDAYRDRRASRYLLEMGTRTDRARIGGYVGRWAHGPGNTALGLLRGYDEESRARLVIESGLRELSSKDANTWGESMENKLQAHSLRALLASWDYAKALPDSRRKDYQEFERRLWRAWGLSRTGMLGGAAQYYDALTMFRWEDRFEEAYIRIFSCSESLEDELLLAEYMAPHLSAVGTQRLEAIATGTSPWARNAERALSAIAKKQGPRKGAERIAQ